MVALIVLVPLWVYPMFVRRGPITLGASRRPMTPVEKAGALAFLSVLVLLLLGALMPLISAVAVSAAFTLLHATLRPQNTKAKLSKFGADVRMAMGGGEDAAEGRGRGGLGGFADNVFGQTTHDAEGPVMLSDAEGGAGVDPELFAGGGGGSAGDVMPGSVMNHRRGGGGRGNSAAFVPAFAGNGAPGGIPAAGGPGFVSSPASLPRPAHVRND
jgi:hypothetical protein